MNNSQENDQVTSPQLEWSETLCDGNRVSMNEAEAAAKALGEGWRLPTRDELVSIVDLSRFNPAADTKTFPDTKSLPYWTATPCAWDSSARWVVYFSNGFVDGYGDYGRACVRACRPSQ